jgi:DNA-binding GntR family transcriptional regulator
MLEVAGVRAAGSARDADIAALRAAQVHYAQAVASRDQQAAVAAHLGFHAALVGLLGSSRLSATAQALLADVRLAMATAARTDDDAARQVADHERLLGLVEASVDGDNAAADAAEAEVVEHLARGAASLAAHVHRRTPPREGG